jgi:hypothetical protein
VSPFGGKERGARQKWPMKMEALEEVFDEFRRGSNLFVVSIRAKGMVSIAFSFCKLAVSD